MQTLKLVLMLVVGMSISGCGRKWEQLWGQDTRPETRYIPLTPDQFEMSIGSVNPFQWGDGRFRKARYLNVWACTSNNMCVGLPKEIDNNGDLIVDGFAAYVLDYNSSIITIWNLNLVRIGGIAPSKVRFQLVM